MENSKLQKMLEAHKLWIDSNKRQGEPANLREANLYEANLDFLVRSSLLLWRNTNYRRP